MHRIILALLLLSFPIALVFRQHKFISKTFHRHCLHHRVSFILFTLLLLIFIITFTSHRHLPQLQPSPSNTPTNFAKAVLSTATTIAPFRIIFYTEARANGFGAQLLRILNAYALARLTNSTFCIHEARYWNYGCAPNRGWSCYFQSPVPSPLQCPNITTFCPELNNLTATQFISSPCVRITSDTSARQAAAVLLLAAAHDPHVCRRFANALWRLKPEVADDVARVQRTLHMKDDTDFVGLHVRRGDKIKEVMLPPLKKYANAVTLMASNQTTVFIATDDGSVLSPLQNMLSPRPVVFMPAAMRRQGHIQGNMNRLFLKTNYERVIVLLAEIEMLRKATVFVSTFSSNLARLVHVLRRQDVNKSVSLDDRWEPGVAWRTFGMNYCDAPGANEVFCANM